jgi:hypothetical protein
VAAVGAGTQCLVILAVGEADGFCRSAHRTVIMAGGLPMVAGKTPMAGEAATVPPTTGARSGIPTGTGEASLMAGVIHSKTGFKPSYLSRGFLFAARAMADDKPAPRCSCAKGAAVGVPER